MREIKFRGKEIKNNKWCYGFLFKSWDNAYIQWGTTNDNPNMTEVYLDTVGQFTGLYDKNYKEIYEGDVLTGISNNEFSLGDKVKHKVIWGIDHWHMEGTLFTLQEFFNYCNNNVYIDVEHETS